MNSTVIAIRTLLALFTLGVAVVLLGMAFPLQASAAEVSVQTAQLLPPGGNTCTQLQASGFTPYVYNGALHGFEFTVADSSYVAIAGSVGDLNIPFHQMTRRIESSGSVRIHVDMATVPVSKDLSIRVTLLSAKSAPQAVCISSISTTIPAEKGVSQATSIPAPSPKPSSGTSATKPVPGTGDSTMEATTTPPLSADTGKTPATSTKATAAAITQNILKDMCSSVSGSSRLWFILLAIYAVIVVTMIFGQPQILAQMRTQEWTAAAIVVPFLLLFGFWYFAESCRVSAWVPAIATFIALAGLSAAFWNPTPKSASVINLPGAKM